MGREGGGKDKMIAKCQRKFVYEVLGKMQVQIKYFDLGER